MSYLVLARKWRPKDFADTVGQEHVLQALINALDSGRLHHAYLFTGTRGVGKTTIARILAKALNCEKGVTSEPCGECSACLEIDEGRFVDLIEVDAASKTKVDDTRDLLDNVQYAPARGRYKVYLIDEVHMLSKSSFNALLKTLEEPPPHVKFLLATTDPQKLPVTVLSRCLQFNLKRMTPRLISDRLAHICEAESIEAETSGTGDDRPRRRWQYARCAESARPGDRVLRRQDRGGQVATMLGTIDRDHVVRLLRLLADNDAKGIIDAIREIDEQFPNYSRLLEDLARDLQRIAVYQVVGTCDSEDDLNEQEIRRAFRGIAGSGCAAVLPDRYPGPARSAPGTGPAQWGGDDVVAHAGVSTGRRGRGAGPRLAAVRRASSAKPASKAAPAAMTAQPRQAQRTSGRPPAYLADPDWSALVGQLGLGGRGRLLASNCAYAAARGQYDSPGSRSALGVAAHQATQGFAGRRLSTHFGEKLAVDITLGAEAGETPVQEESRMADERMEAARQTLEADPNVQTSKNMFGAELKTDSIELINPPQSD